MVSRVRRTARVLAGTIVALACGGDDGSGPPPPPGNYTVVEGEAWSTYANDAALMAQSLFGWGASGVPGPIDNYVDLVSDGTFGKAARILQQAGTAGSPQMHQPFTALDKAWVRWHIRYSPGWTAVGATGPSLGNAWKQMHLYMPGGGATGRTRLDVENSTQFGCGFSFPGRSYTETPLPGHQGGGAGCGTALVAGGVGDEFNDGAWYEWIAYHEKTGATTGRIRYWHRQLAQSTFRFSGWSYTGATGADLFPQVHELALGVNKNRDTPADQYVYWGPFEVVDGSQYPDPWGVGP